VPSNLYYPVHNSTFYAVNLKTHSVFWSTHFNSSLGMQDTSPAVWGDVVVSGYAKPTSTVMAQTNTSEAPNYTIEVYLVGINASNGKVMWRFDEGSGHMSPRIVVPPVTAYDGVVYSDTFSIGKLYAVNITTGSELWAVPTGPSVSNVNIVNGDVVITNIHGDIFVINKYGQIINTEHLNISSGSDNPAVVGHMLAIGGKNGRVEVLPIGKVINSTIAASEFGASSYR
jgi:outer membrane protein assembly factor BamB